MCLIDTISSKYTRVDGLPHSKVTIVSFYLL
nr:MAG TPA: hypothetical protein [Caudoviricetes sp.]